MASKSLPTSTKIILALAALALLAVFSFFYINMDQRAEKKKAISSIDQERQQLEEKVTGLEKKLAGSDLSESGPDYQPGTSPHAVLPGGEEDMEAGSSIAQDEHCANIIERMDRFFHYLDNQEYIKQFNFEKGSQAYFAEITKQLYARKPQIIRENDSLLTLLQNSAHLFRVLGKRNIETLKMIMENERDSLEPVLEAFYQGAKANDRCLDAKYPVTLPIQDLYTYSAFFLNSMGGQAYLFRRDPMTRLLARYYALRIVHDANERNMNTAGIDIRPGIKSLIDELLVTSAVKHREDYLNTMLVLQAQYDEQYGLGEGMHTD